MDWDWVKRIAPTTAIIGTVVGMFFLFDGWQKERFLWLAGDIADLSKRIDRVETRIAGVETRLASVETRIDSMETRIVGDIADVSKRVDRIETLSATAMAQMRRMPEDGQYTAQAFGIIGGDTMIRLLSGKRTAVPLAFVAIDPGKLQPPDLRKTLQATYSDNMLTLYPDAWDREVIALLRDEGWRPVDPENVNSGFIPPRSPGAN